PRSTFAHSRLSEAIGCLLSAVLVAFFIALLDPLQVVLGADWAWWCVGCCCDAGLVDADPDLLHCGDECLLVGFYAVGNVDAYVLHDFIECCMVGCVFLPSRLF